PLFRSVGFASPETGLSTILTSPDGYNWTERMSPSVQTLRGVAYGDGSFVAAGEQATILQSGRPVEFRLTANGFGAGGFELLVSGEPGVPYRLQTSTNFNVPTWIDRGAFTNAQPATTVTDSTATQFSQRFYRVVSPY